MVYELNSKYDAVIDSEYTGGNGLLVNGVKTYRLLSEALRDAPEKGEKPFVIFIKSGRYYEQLIIDKPNIKLIGDNKDTTKLTYDAASGRKRPDGTNYGTTGSSSVTITGVNFSAENITFENGFDYPSNEYKVAEDPSRVSGSQAVALKTAMGNNQALFVNCNFLGYQDTLYIDAGYHFFKECYIEGNIDFIFGAGQAVFEGCTIASIGRVGSVNNGYITAPSTLISNKYGFVFIDCKLVKANIDTNDHTVTLGRPWHPTTSFPDGSKFANPNAIGSAVFIKCYLDSHIKPDGWDKMSGKDKDGNTIWFFPDDINHSRFYEFESIGPGAVSDPSKTRKFFTEEEVREYTDIVKVLGGWKPDI